MFGEATLYIPENEDIGPTYDVGLSDELAMSIGRTAAWTLSDEHMFVIVTLANGSVRVIGHDTVRGELTIGRLRKNHEHVIGA